MDNFLREKTIKAFWHWISECDDQNISQNWSFVSVGDLWIVYFYPLPRQIGNEKKARCFSGCFTQSFVCERISTHLKVSPSLLARCYWIRELDSSPNILTGLHVEWQLTAQWEAGSLALYFLEQRSRSYPIPPDSLLFFMNRCEVRVTRTLFLSRKNGMDFILCNDPLTRLLL